MDTSAKIMKSGKNKPPFNKMRFFEGTVSLFFFLIICVLLTGFLPVRHELITKKVMEFFKEAGADSCRISSVKIIPWRGIFIDGININDRFSNNRYSLHMRSMDISCNLLNLYLSIRKKGIDNPLNKHDIFTFTSERPALVLRHFIAFLLEMPEIKHITLSHGDLIISEDSMAIIKLKDFTLKTIDENNTRGPRSTLGGNFNIEWFGYRSLMHLEQLKGEFRADRDKMTIEGCRGKVLDGKGKGGITLDLIENQIAHSEVSINNLNLEKYYKAVGDTSSQIKGIADVNLEFYRSEMSLDSLNGRGTVTATRFEISKLPLQQSLATMFEIPQLSQLQFRKMRTGFELRKGRVFKTETEGTGELVNFKAAGWIQGDGTMDQAIEGVLTRKFTQELPKIVSASMEPTRDDGRMFRIRVYGSFDTPRLELDKKIISRAVGNVFESMKDGLKEMFK